MNDTQMKRNLVMQAIDNDNRKMAFEESGSNGNLNNNTDLEHVGLH